MKANELRIGNLVMVDPQNFPQQVCDVMCDCVNTENVQGAHYGLIDAVQLTEEWLLKFGFSINGIVFWKKSLFLVYFKGLFYIMPNINRRTQRGLVIKYVHQLQNLYFALTGEELTYAQHSKCTCAYESQYRNCAKQCERDND
jgi:hypothetical protein